MKHLAYIYKKLQYKKLFMFSIAVLAFGNASAAIMRDNDFYLYYGKDVTSLSMDYHGAEISAGQANKDKDKEFTIDNDQYDKTYNMTMLKGVLKAGRHKTEAIANAFINAVDAKKDGKCYSILQAYMMNGGYVCPNALNFYIVTTLHINGSEVINPVYFAQGNTNGINNWWVGSIDAIKNTEGSSNEYFYLVVKTKSGDTYRISEFSGKDGMPNNNAKSFIISKLN